MPLLAAYARAIVADKTAAREIREQGAVVNGKPNAWLVPKEKAHREVVVLSLRLSPQGRAQHAPVSGPTSYYDRMRSARQHDEAD